MKLQPGDGLYLDGERWSEGWWLDEDGFFHPRFRTGLTWEIIWQGKQTANGVIQADGNSGAKLRAGHES